jgi:hypothetical protein
MAQIPGNARRKRLQQQEIEMMGTIVIEEETIALKPEGTARVVLWTTTGDMMDAEDVYVY